MKSNITKTVQQISKLDISGNIIPENWYNTIVKENQRGVKPYLEAIVILSDIVYWYKPTMVRDELSGKLVEIRKKFKADKLQKSYQALSEKFGFSKKVAAQACKHLSDIGVINIEYRNIKTSFTVCTNVTFIDIDVDKLIELTFPNGIDHIPEMGNMDLPKSDRPINPIGQDVYKDYEQKNTTKNTNTINEECEIIYLKYPNVSQKGASLRNGKKSRDKIKTKLKKYSKDEIVNVIDWYIKSCNKSNTYYQKLDTFLNNFDGHLENSKQPVVEKKQNKSSVTRLTF